MKQKKETEKANHWIGTWQKSKETTSREQRKISMFEKKRKKKKKKKKKNKKKKRKWRDSK